MQCYNVMLNGCIVGTAIVETEGLYLRFRIRCKPPDSQIYRLVMLCGSQQMDLGVCVPEDDHFVLNKRIQSKLVGEGEPQFFLAVRKNVDSTLFIQVDTEKPFGHLDRLPAARFEIRDGACGLALFQQ